MSLTPSFLQHVQNVAGVEREHWPDQFLQWYSPGEWLNAERAAAVFIGQKIEQLRGELDRLTADRDSWEQQASDRTDDAVWFARERDDARAEVQRLRGQRKVLADLLRQARDPLETMLHDGENDQDSHDMLLTLSCDINAALAAIDADALSNAQSTGAGS